jgi:hypothetical protein
MSSILFLFLPSFLPACQPRQCVLFAAPHLCPCPCCIIHFLSHVKNRCLYYPQPGCIYVCLPPSLPPSLSVCSSPSLLRFEHIIDDSASSGESGWKLHLLLSRMLEVLHRFPGCVVLLVHMDQPQNISLQVRRVDRVPVIDRGRKWEEGREGRRRTRMSFSNSGLFSRFPYLSLPSHSVSVAYHPLSSPSISLTTSHDPYPPLLLHPFFS